MAKPFAGRHPAKTESPCRDFGGGFSLEITVTYEECLRSWFDWMDAVWLAICAFGLWGLWRIRHKLSKPVFFALFGAVALIAILGERGLWEVQYAMNCYELRDW